MNKKLVTFLVVSAAVLTVFLADPIWPVNDPIWPVIR